MLSAKEGAAQKRALARDRDRALREKTRTTIRGLREAWRTERMHRDDALAGAAAHCRAERQAVREKAHARRLRALAELRDASAAERAAAREVCMLRKAQVHASAKDPLERAHGKWKAERAYHEDLRRIEQGNSARHRALKKSHAAERRSESDDEVRASIPPDYVALFERVKRSIKGGARQSRTEAFLKFAEENPGDLLEALDDDSDRMVRELEAQRAKADRRTAAAHPRPPRKASKYTPEELAAVPF